MLVILLFGLEIVTGGTDWPETRGQFVYDILYNLLKIYTDDAPPNIAGSPGSRCVYTSADRRQPDEDNRSLLLGRHSCNMPESCVLLGIPGAGTGGKKRNQPNI